VRGKSDYFTSETNGYMYYDTISGYNSWRADYDKNQEYLVRKISYSGMENDLNMLLKYIPGN